MTVKRNEVHPRFVRNIVSSKRDMVCDDNFQRDYVWLAKDRRDFIKSVFLNQAVSGIILADIDSCLRATKASGDQYSTEILKKQKRKDKTQSKVDGEQRTTTLWEFVDDGFTITGKFVDNDGKEHLVENRLFSDLPNRLQDKFLDTQLPVCTLYGYTYKEMVQVFKNIQKGVALSSAEIRWADLTPYNGWVKNQRPRFKEVFEKVDAVEKKIVRKKDVETFDQVMLSLMGHTKLDNCGQSDLNKFYAAGDGKRALSNVPEYDVAQLNRASDVFFDLIKPVIIHNKKHYTKVPIRTFWAVSYVCEYLYDNNLTVLESKLPEFYEFVYNLDRDLCNDSKQVQASDLNTLIESPDSQYYWWWCGVPHNAKVRQRRIEALIARLLGALPQDFIVDESLKIDVV